MIDNSDTAKIPVICTMGDPSGIGLDITLEAWLKRQTGDIPPFCLVAAPELIARRAETLKLTVPLEIIPSPANSAVIFENALPVIPIEAPSNLLPGQPNVNCAESILKSIEIAISFLHKGEASALVTNPINKALLYKAGFSYQGHTDYLATFAQMWGAQSSPVMMLVAREMRVVPVTVHIPLQDVPGALTPELISQTVRIVGNDLKHCFGLNYPKIAVTGLNPHAGEDGAMGTEEKTIISPAIEQLRSENFNVSGPYPADTIFHDAARRDYDVIIAMYHDQALIPIKTLAFERSVNVTLGLPFIRTSPDHGTAYNIAGTGQANPQSFIEAVRLAAQLTASKQDQCVAAAH